MTDFESMGKPVTDWLQRHSLTPLADEHPDWGFSLHFSTDRIRDWSVRRSKIKPDALWFGLTISRLVGWRATLYPRDKSFCVSWSSNSGMSVDSSSLLHRHRTPWPAITDLDDIPDVVKTIASILNVSFLREAELTGATLKTEDFPVLSRWLAPVCDRVTYILGDIRGALPECEDVEDGRANHVGIRLTLATAC